MSERIKAVPELFLVAIDRENGKIAGFLNGIATEEEFFRDEFFTDATLNNPEGKNVMLLGLDVLPEYRGQEAEAARYSSNETAGTSLGDLLSKFKL